MSNATGTETLRQLGMLGKQRREEIGLSRAALVKEAGIDSEDEIRDFEFGRSLPPADIQRNLEKALDWRPGAINDAMEKTDRPASTMTMEELDAEDSLYLAARSVAPSLISASDSELLAEVARRGL